MPQSLSNLAIHVIFSTAGRVPFVEEDRLERLWAYGIGVLRQLECPAIQIGGRPDHLHLLFRLSRTDRVSDVVKEVKTSTSKWLKPQHDALSSFAWQAGYAAFSVSPRDIDMVRSYIQNQERHHHKHSFQEELRAILKTEGVEFDERYLWE